MTTDPAPSSAATILRSMVPLAAAVVLAVVFQLFVRPLLGDFVSKVVLDIATNIILAVSLTMVNGFTGQFSMGHAAFMAVGGYTAAAMVYYGSFRLFGNAQMSGGLLSAMTSGRSGFLLIKLPDLLFAASILAGGLVSAACGFLVGLPSLRLRGDYLAIVTLGFGEIVRILIQALTSEVLSVGAPITADQIKSIPAWHQLTEYDPITAANISRLPIHLWPKYIGGSLGFTGLPFYSSLFWSILLACITLIVAYRLKNSSYGRAFLSIREDEIASEAMGVNTTRYKVWAFVIAAFFAGSAGALFAHTSGVQFKSDELGFQKSFDIIIMVVLGGLGSISGAAIAAAIVTILPELLRNPSQLAFVLAPLAVVLVILAGVGGQTLPEAPRRKRLIGLLSAAALCLALSGIGVYCGTHGIDLGRYRMIIFALALIILMIVRPQGLLGVREIWDFRRGARNP